MQRISIVELGGGGTGEASVSSVARAFDDGAFDGDCGADEGVLVDEVAEFAGKGEEG